MRTAKTSVSFFDKLLLVIFPISSINFYGYIGFNQNVCKIIYTIIFTFTALYVLPILVKKNNNTVYTKIVRLLFVLMLFSIIMSYLFWGQDIYLNYGLTIYYAAILYFFLLMKIKPSFAFIERILWLFFLFYIIAWFYGIINAPRHVIGNEMLYDIDDSRGFYRLEVPSMGFLPIIFFLSIVKYTITKRISWIYISCVIFALIVMHVTRQMIFWIFLIGIYYILKHNKYLWTWMIVASVILVFLNGIEIDKNSIFGKILALTGEQIEDQKSGEENIRITEYKFFFTDYSTELGTIILGNGIPHPKGLLGKMEMKANDEYLYANDVGYAEIFIKFGLVGLVIYILLLYNVWRRKVPRNYEYAKLYIVFVYFMNFGSSWILYQPISICICLYILEQCEINRKYQIVKEGLKHEIFNRDTSLQVKILK